MCHLIGTIVTVIQRQIMVANRMPWIHWSMEWWELEKPDTITIPLLICGNMVLPVKELKTRKFLKDEECLVVDK